MARRSIGKITVAAGSDKQQEIEIKDFIRCSFPDHRLISICNLEKKAGYIISVENPESSGRSNQKIWLSYESFIGFIATAVIYANHAKIDIQAEAEKMKGREINFEYAKR